MIIDTLTEWVAVWGVITVVAIIAIAVCDGCCIAKLRGRPCNK